LLPYRYRGEFQNYTKKPDHDTQFAFKALNSYNFKLSQHILLVEKYLDALLHNRYELQKKNGGIMAAISYPRELRGFLDTSSK